MTPVILKDSPQYYTYYALSRFLRESAGVLLDKEIDIELTATILKNFGAYTRGGDFIVWNLVGMNRRIEQLSRYLREDLVLTDAQAKDLIGSLLLGVAHESSHIPEGLLDVTHNVGFRSKTAHLLEKMLLPQNSQKIKDALENLKHPQAAFVTLEEFTKAMANKQASSPIQQSGSAISLAEIEDVGKSMSLMIRKRSQIKDIVERPLIKACEILYDKNIRTFSTSANKKDLRFSLLNDGNSYAYIMIDYKSLSDENKKIINDLLNGSEMTAYKDAIIKHASEDGDSVDILIPINESSTDIEVSKKAVEATDIFQKQRMTWSPIYTLDQLREFYFSPEATIEDFKRYFYYNEDNKLFYLNKEHYHKIINSESKVGSSAIETPGGIDIRRERMDIEVRQGQGLAASGAAPMAKNTPGHSPVFQFDPATFQGFTFEIVSVREFSP